MLSQYFTTHTSHCFLRTKGLFRFLLFCNGSKVKEQMFSQSICRFKKGLRQKLLQAYIKAWIATYTNHFRSPKKNVWTLIRLLSWIQRPFDYIMACFHILALCIHPSYSNYITTGTKTPLFSLLSLYGYQL